MNQYSGRTIAEAIEAGLKDLNLTSETAQIEIVDEGHSGVFGLGARPALVRISALATDSSLPADDPAPAPPAEEPNIEPEPEPEVAVAPPPSVEPVAEAPEAEAAEAVDEATRVLELSQEFLQRMLDLMSLQTRVEAETHAPEQAGDEPVYYLNITGEDLGILIGRRGETLNAIQYLVRLYANRHLHYWPRIEIDVEAYKQRRTVSLQKLAVTMADRAASSGKTVVLEAMSARERRLIHLALRDRSDVITKSVGEGDNRKVTIIPTA
ncbi:MAG: protein jag [Chloroflexi bacterium]|nr:protein jag [Chloroflexota bacterium]